VCVCACTQVVRRAHTRKHGVQKNYFSKNVLYRHVNVQKHLRKNIFLCAPCFHKILLDQDFFRHLLSDIFVSILNCLNVFDITILGLYIISEPCIRKKALSRHRKLAIASICLEFWRKCVRIIKHYLHSLVLMRIKSYHLPV